MRCASTSQKHTAENLEFREIRKWRKKKGDDQMIRVDLHPHRELSRYFRSYFVLITIYLKV